MTASDLAELYYLAQRDANVRSARCSGKEKFDSYSVAMQAVSHRGKKAGAHPYRCGFCGHWHVGTTIIPKGRRREIDGEKNASHVRHA